MAQESKSAREAMPLEELILSLQKSMSKAAEITAAANTSEIAFLTGRRALYNIRELDIELNAAILPGDDKGLVKVDLEAPKEQRSIIRFQIQRQTFNPLEGPKILISKLRSLESDRDMNNESLVVWIINEFDQPEPNYPFTLRFTTGGMNPVKPKVITNLKTDISGKLNFSFTVSSRKVSILGGGNYLLRQFDHELDWYVQAEMELANYDETEDDEPSEDREASETKEDKSVEYPRISSELIQIHFAER